MRVRRLLWVAVSLFALGFGAAFVFHVPGPDAEELALPGLTAPVRVITDREGVRHVIARNDLDLARAQGFVHARDRLFQMDAARREVSGDLAELLGAAVLGRDVQNRTIGLRRAAERSAGVLRPHEEALLQAYADGVNAFLASHPLPPEYGVLELTEVRPWTIVDTLAIGKGIAASLSLDLDIDATLQLLEYGAACALQGCNGQALFFEDVRRAAPMDPAATVPDATGGTPFLMARAEGRSFAALAPVAEAAARYRRKAEASPRLAHALERLQRFQGSNEWGVAGSHSVSRRPMIANDPHLSLDTPSTFYEIHLVVKGGGSGPESRPMNVSGVGFPGAPGVILGQNERITWGATTNPMDVSDIFNDTLIVGACPPPALACIQSEGELHPVVTELAEYRVNVIGDGVPDNLADSGLPPEQRLIATVPFRSFGPILDITDPSVLQTGGQTSALVLQFTGFHATRELSAFQTWNRARNLQDFLEGLRDFDFGSQNWAYADADGNLAYFTSGELPLRKDLEAGTLHDGLHPGFIRDGSGPANWVPEPSPPEGQAIPYQILPFEEMPHVVNPPRGFFVNANNDPAGVSLDNDPVNQVRPSKPGAIYYLNPGFANGLRAGRITRLVEGALERGRKLSLFDMRRFQLNTQQLDAELMTPFLVEAYRNANRLHAPPALQALAQDEQVAEAVQRLAVWDFSTPTGIPEGYDASDFRGERRRRVPPGERRASVAATLYNLWRGKLIEATVDRALAELGVSGTGSSDALKALHHLLSQDPFTGMGASGVSFFPEPAGLPAADRRDVTLLEALRAALDDLASDAFAPAFANSTELDDYRWGKLHRITFDHPLGAPFSIPPAAGFEDLAPGLPGLSRDGGYEVVNASGFSARATGLQSFRFGGGPVRRYVGLAGFGLFHGPRVLGFNVIPGGASGVLGSPLYASQLGDWLTGEVHLVTMLEFQARHQAQTVEVLTPGGS